MWCDLIFDLDGGFEDLTGKRVREEEFSHSFRAKIAIVMRI